LTILVRTPDQNDPGEAIWSGIYYVFHIFILRGAHTQDVNINISYFFKTGTVRIDLIDKVVYPVLSLTRVLYYLMSFWIISSFVFIVISLTLRRPKTLTIPRNSKNIQYFQMKLGTYVPRNKTHIYTKSHNSSFNNYRVMTVFWLKKQTSVGTHSAVLLIIYCSLISEIGRLILEAERERHWLSYTVSTSISFSRKLMHLNRATYNTLI